MNRRDLKKRRVDEKDCRLKGMGNTVKLKKATNTKNNAEADQ